MTALWIFGGLCFVSGAGAAAAIILWRVGGQLHRLESERIDADVRAIQREQALVALQFEHAMFLSREAERRGEVRHG